MRTFLRRLIRICWSGSLRVILSFSVAISASITGVLFVKRRSMFFGGEQEWGQFWWQAFLGITAGLVVGFIVDAVTGLNKNHNVIKFFSGINPHKKLQVVLATIQRDNNDNSYMNTGPGETVALGLLIGAYSAIFSHELHVVTSKNILVIPSKLFSEEGKKKFDGHRYIFGGPKYNQVTRKFLELPTVPIHYATDSSGSFLNRLETKGLMENGSPGKWEPANDTEDFGLIVRHGREMHVSGCRTWGVIGAATCLFSESMAKILAEYLHSEKINPSQDNFYAVVRCGGLSSNKQFTIEDLQIMHVAKIL